MSLKLKAKSSLLWVLIENVFVKGFSFFVTIGLTRLLSPKDYGLIGIIAIFILLATVIIESGMGTSIIRDNDADDTDFSTVFYGNMLLSLFVYPILYFTAPFIADYFRQPILVSLIWVYSVTIIISAFFSIQQSLLVKNLAFKKLGILSFPGIIIG